MTKNRIPKAHLPNSMDGLPGDLTDLTSATLAFANLLANCMDWPAVIQAFISA